MHTVVVGDEVRLERSSIAPRLPRYSPFVRLDLMVRFGVAFEMLAAKLGGRIFTLRFSQDVAKATESHKDPIGYLRKRLSNSFSRLGMSVPPLAFVLEMTPLGRSTDEDGTTMKEPQAHLHGVIATAGCDSKLLNQALRDAGGTLRGRAAARQLKLQEFVPSLGGPFGWSRYCWKDARRTRRLLAVKKVHYLPQVVNRLATAYWDEWYRSRARLH